MAIHTILGNIFDKFPAMVRHLERGRYNKRPRLEIDDEYDVQYILHTFLMEHFDDIRIQEWTPSYAGSSNRMDFLLNAEKVVIEVKMTRSSLKDKEIGEHLIIDIANYRKHPKCKQVYCFIYDKDGYISNPLGLEKDLEEHSSAEVGVKVFIRPR